MRTRLVAALLVAVTLWAVQWGVPGARADILLGAFNFSSALFGNTVTPSDGGTHAAENWLNTVNVDPGNPGYLTGANFDTGIANIGLIETPSYTIGYDTPITNGAGDDFGIVVARFSTDPVTIAVSTDGGATFTADAVIAAGSAIDTLETRDYFYAGGGPFSAGLFVHPIDLSDFGLADGAQIDAIRVTTTDEHELDLVRVAGFEREGQQDVPEPTTLFLLGVSLSCAVAARRFRG